MASSWTTEQNKKFETALAGAFRLYKHFTDDFWNYMVKEVGEGKTVEDVKEHYEKLEQDVKDIEEGRVPIPDYKDKEMPKDKPMPKDSDKGKDN
ncbi:hypothetical protein ACHQM5_027628 [Ranunculus cassubicifolius]